MARKLAHADPVHKVSIVARGGMGGYTRLLPDEDRHLWSKTQFKDMLAVSMGGRVAEEIIFVDVTTGASNDLSTATNIARQMVTRYGMSDKLGPRTFGKREEMVFLGREISEQRDYSDRIAEDIDTEVHMLVDEAYSLARDTPCWRIATSSTRSPKYLIEHETVEGPELAELFDSEAPVSERATPAAAATTVVEPPEEKPAKSKQRTPRGRSSGPNTAPAPAS